MQEVEKHYVCGHSMEQNACLLEKFNPLSATFGHNGLLPLAPTPSSKTTKRGASNNEAFKNFKGIKLKVVLRFNMMGRSVLTTDGIKFV